MTCQICGSPMAPISGGMYCCPCCGQQGVQAPLTPHQGSASTPKIGNPNSNPG